MKEVFKFIKCFFGFHNFEVKSKKMQLEQYSLWRDKKELTDVIVFYKVCKDCGYEEAYYEFENGNIKKMSANHAKHFFGEVK